MNSVGTIKVLKSLRDTPTTLGFWHEGMSALSKSGVFDLLLELAKVRQFLPDTPNYVDAQAAEANRAFGANQVIDTLMNFRELLQGVPTKEEASADFGALDASLNNQDITKEEYDALRHNQPIPRLEPQPAANFASDNSSKTPS